MSEEKAALLEARGCLNLSEESKHPISTAIALRAACEFYEQAIKEERQKARRDIAEKAIELAYCYVKSPCNVESFAQMYNWIDFKEFECAIRAEAEKE